MEFCGSQDAHAGHHYIASDSNGYWCEGFAALDDDRAAQISARLAGVRASEDPEIWNYSGDALADLAWLLAERAELLRRAEAAEERAEWLDARAYDSERRVEAAERAGAVKAAEPGKPSIWPFGVTL